MSTEDESESSPSDGGTPYLGTKMGRARTNTRGLSNLNSPRFKFNTQYTSLDGPLDDRFQLGMFSTDQQPTVWEAVNYPHEEEFEFDSFYLRYTRQAEAKAIIDKPVNDTWQDMPTVHDEAHKEQSKAVSDFEKAVAEFFEGEHTRRKPIHRLNVLDRLARLGHYSVLLIGFRDGRDMDTPVAGVTSRESLSDDERARYERDPAANLPDEMGEPEFESLDDVMYLAVFGEDRVIDLRTNSDMNSPRFRLPEIFDLVTEKKEEGEDDTDYENQKVHWTRLIHVPEGTLEDDLRGIPALKPVFHELLNIDKVKAASGEGFWRAGYQGLHVRPPQDAQGRFMEFENNGDDVKQEIEDFIQNFDRTLSTPAEINPIDNSVGNPMPHLDANYQSIAAATDIPKSILTGEDRADTASEDDFHQYKSYISQRRNNYAGPAIVEPLIQRLVDTGVIPEPEGDGFTIEWPPLDELSPLQQWERNKVIAETIKALSPGGDTSQFGTVAELRQAVGWGPQVGSEVNETETNPSEAEQRPDEAQGGDTSDGFPYPDELFEQQEGAQERAAELGLEGRFQTRRFEDGVFYVPGESIDELEAALGETTTENLFAGIPEPEAASTDGGSEI